MTPREFIDAIKPAALACQAASGIPASFTIAQAALESAWGKSQLAREGFNLFGIKADAGWGGDVLELPTKEFEGGQWITVNARWRRYADWQGSIDDHAEFFRRNRRYAACFRETTGDGWARAVAAAGYATDPNYAGKLIATMNAHHLQALDLAETIPVAPAGSAEPTAPAPPPKEATMLPFVAAGITALIQAAPALIRVFGDSPRAEKNAQAAEVVADLAKQVTGESTVEGAVHAIQADPAQAAAFREQVHLSMNELVGLAERIVVMERIDIQAARQYNAEEPLFLDFGWLRLKFIHFLSVGFVAFSGAFVWRFFEQLTPELKGAVITLMVIAGYVGVKDYWMSSSAGSALKNEMLKNRGSAPPQP